MNLSVKILSLGLIIAGLNSSVSAQSANSGSSASANVTATIITPLTIVKKLDMNFGSVSVNGNNGTVVLSCSGTVTPTGGCAVISPGNASTSPSQASFDVTGDGTDSFTITLPTATISLNPAGTVTVGSWYTPTKTFNLVSGSATTIPIGATLNIVAGTSTGTYTMPNGLAVSVNYN